MPESAHHDAARRTIGAKIMRIDSLAWNLRQGLEKTLHRIPLFVAADTRRQGPDRPGGVPRHHSRPGQSHSPVPTSQQVQIARHRLGEKPKETCHHHQLGPIGQEGEMRNPSVVTQKFDSRLQGIQQPVMGLLLILIREVDACFAVVLKFEVNIPVGVGGPSRQECMQDGVVINLAPVETDADIVLDGLEGGGGGVALPRREQPFECLGPGQALSRVVHAVVDLAQHPIVLGAHLIDRHVELAQPLGGGVDLVDPVDVVRMLTDPAQQPRQFEEHR